MINYSLSQKRNPQDPEGPRKWYASAQASGEADINDLAEEIAHATSLTEGDVMNAIRSLENRIIYHLERGHIVRLEVLGDFRATISSEGVDAEDDFNESKIRKVNVRYSPGDRILSAMQPVNLQFRKAPLRSEVEAIGDDEEETPGV